MVFDAVDSSGGGLARSRGVRLSVCGACMRSSAGVSDHSIGVRTETYRKETPVLQWFPASLWARARSSSGI